MAHIEGDPVAGEMLGVTGTWRRAVLAPGLWYNQKFKSHARTLPGDPKTKVRAEVRFDDSCRNGHNSFAVTGTIYELCDYSEHGRMLSTPQWRETGGGCVHEQVAAAFPELAHLIKWHLTDTTGPMHYIANTLYLAGDRDHWGLRAGEERPLRNGKTGETYRELVAVNEPGILSEHYANDAKYTGRKYVPLHALRKDIRETPDAVIPNPPTLIWRTQMVTGEGKKRELDAARRVAVWPDAPDSVLELEPEELRKHLERRLPALLQSFEADIRGAGLFWTPSETPAKAYENA